MMEDLQRASNTISSKREVSSLGEYSGGLSFVSRQPNLGVLVFYTWQLRTEISRHSLRELKITRSTFVLGLNRYGQSVRWSTRVRDACTWECVIGRRGERKEVSSEQFLELMNPAVSPQKKTSHDQPVCFVSRVQFALITLCTFKMSLHN